LHATEKEIALTHSEISDRIERWRDLQSTHMASVRPMVISQAPCGEELEQLFLPSHFSADERVNLDLTQLATTESKLREAQAFKCIIQLRQIMKIISVLQHQRKKHGSGQRHASRSHSKIQSVRGVRFKTVQFRAKSIGTTVLVSCNIFDSILQLKN
jgi:hypothetical protein